MLDPVRPARAGAEVAPVPEGGDRSAEQLGGFGDREQCKFSAGGVVGHGWLRGAARAWWTLHCRRRSFAAIADSLQRVAAVLLRFFSCGGGRNGGAWPHEGAGQRPGRGAVLRRRSDSPRYSGSGGRTPRRGRCEDGGGAAACRAVRSAFQRARQVSRSWVSRSGGWARRAGSVARVAMRARASVSCWWAAPCRRRN